MNWHQSEGIVIHTLKFRDRDQIATVFSPQWGIIKLIIKGALGSRPQSRKALDPLTRVEYVFYPRKSEIFTCQETAVIHPYLSLRDHWGPLEAAGEMIQVIQKTQMPGKAAPELYHLLCLFLEKLLQVQDPKTLSTSFYLKTLKYEGFLGLSSIFDQQETGLVFEIANSRSFDFLRSLTLASAFHQKVKDFFYSML